MVAATPGRTPVVASHPVRPALVGVRDFVARPMTTGVVATAGSFPNYPNFPAPTAGPWPAGIPRPVLPTQVAVTAIPAQPSGWQWSVNGQFGVVSGSYNGSTVQGGLSAGPLGVSTTDGSISIDGMVPVVGIAGVTGGVDLNPDSTTVRGGPYVGVPDANISIQGGYTFPYGYQNATDWATGWMNPIFGPLADPSTFTDPFVDQ